MSAAMRRRLGPLVLVALQGWACGDPRLLDGFSEGATRLRLAPSEFIGSVPCLKGAPGALQTYVVRLQEVSNASGLDGGLINAETAVAAPCDQAVVFPALPLRGYGAVIHGFDRPVLASDLADPDGRWVATCGHGSSDVPDGGLDPYRPTVGQRGVTVPILGCTSFFAGAPGSTSQLVVDQIGALGSLSCGQGAGRVGAFQGTLDGVSQVALCGEPLVFDVTGPERYHSITLTAFELAADAGALDSGAPDAGVPSPVPPIPALDGGADAGDDPDASLVPPPAPTPAAPSDAGTNGPVALPLGAPRWSTQCLGRSLPGVAAAAYCDPLRPLP
jgi:hypothetical protein